MTPASRPETVEPRVQPGPWVLDAAGSQCRFTVRDKLVATVQGTMPAIGGGATLTPGGEVERAWIEVSVDGIATGNAHRDRDLRKARFLDAGQYPAVRIDVTQARPSATGWRCTATLSARGALAPVDLTADIASGSSEQVRLRVGGRLDRMPLGIAAPTFIVGRYVDLDADLQFRPRFGAEPGRGPAPTVRY